MKIAWPRLRRILVLALPIMAGMVSQNILNLVDTAFVGRLGDDALAAVGMGGFANWLAVSFLLGLGSGVQAIAARRLGEGNVQQAAHGLNAALVVAIGLGVPAAIVAVWLSGDIMSLLIDDPAVQLLGAEYLAARFIATPAVGANISFRGFWNGTDRSLYYFITIVFMHVVNIVLDYGLIFGELGMPEMGVEGAGLATTISVYLGTAFYIVLALVSARRNGFLQLAGLKTLPTTVRLSLWASLQNFSFSAGFVLFYVIAGKISTEALAASSVLVNLALLCILPGLGIGLSGATLVGKALGAGDKDDARRWGWEVTRLGAVVMGLIGLMLALFPETWLSIFIVEESTLQLAVVPLIILGLYQSVDAVGIVLNGVLQGSGDVLATLVISLVSQWVVFLPLAYLTSVVLGWGILALWGCMVVYRSLAAAGVAMRFLSGAWAEARV